MSETGTVFVADALAAEAAAHVAALDAAPADAGADPAAGDAALLAGILEEARRETVAMLGRTAPTTLAIARMVGPGYPLGDAVAAIREADQMAFAGARPQAVDLLSEAIAALAVASVVIREGRE
ncbi:hypothetical protein ABB55_27655 [Prosthecomicrobium hirschii]|uniref:Uncharacterized protein n=1 Tax=Prosthecodimorpha hirschii TaxID=665126 RepID=A0A0P6VW65_9HYPH|nr:hypothetical protein [Prosthecomicrobium hirschii]KPL55544.1 hypothetical protein ABB55_27655 [Prosthecomicrobium hirschii]